MKAIAMSMQISVSMEKLLQVFFASADRMTGIQSANSRNASAWLQQVVVVVSSPPPPETILVASSDTDTGQQAQNVPPASAAAAQPSQANTIDASADIVPGQLRRSLHTRTVPSELPEAMQFSSEKNTTEFTLSVWPVKVCSVCRQPQHNNTDTSATLVNLASRTTPQPNRLVLTCRQNSTSIT